MTTAEGLAALSEWIDAGNQGRPAEAITWGRLAKISEENGEVIAAFIGATGQNPRKGTTHSLDDVRKELLDVAVTALAAYEHLDRNAGSSIAALDSHVARLVERAGLAQPTEERPTREPDMVMTGYLPEIDGVLSEWPDDDYTPDEAVTVKVERDVWYGPWRPVPVPTEEPTTSRRYDNVNVCLRPEPHAEHASGAFNSIWCPGRRPASPTPDEAPK